MELIRMGDVCDGVYLVLNDLEGIKKCFLPGVDKESSFEIDCLNREMEVYMADNSVERPNIDSSLYSYNFIKKNIGITSDDNFITFNKWVSNSNTKLDENILLQMDIEGAEYQTILTMDENLINRFRIILIEFHYLDRLWNKDFFKTADAVFKKLTNINNLWDIIEKLTNSNSHAPYLYSRQGDVRDSLGRKY